MWLSQSLVVGRRRSSTRVAAVTQPTPAPKAREVEARSALRDVAQGHAARQWELRREERVRFTGQLGSARLTPVAGGAFMLSAPPGRSLWGAIEQALALL
jgi:hypothetical protein